MSSSCLMIIILQFINFAIVYEGYQSRILRGGKSIYPLLFQSIEKETSSSRPGEKDNNPGTTLKLSIKTITQTITQTIYQNSMSPSYKMNERVLQSIER